MPMIWNSETQEKSPKTNLHFEMERNERKPAVLSSVEFGHEHFFAIGFYFNTSSYAHYVIAHFGKINYVWSVAVRSYQTKKNAKEEN